VTLKYAYFSGCVTPQKENAYELSIRKVCQKLGIELMDLENTNCCGFFMEPVDYRASLLLAARNLSLFDATGLDAITPCSACFGHLTRVRSMLLENDELRNSINQSLKRVDRIFVGSSKVKHFVGMLLQDIGIAGVRDSVIKPLSKLKIAPHYGCHILKPSDELHLDNPEDPKLLDSLIEATGAKCLEYPEKKLCCGSSAMNVDEKLAIKITKAKLDSIKKSGADAIVTVCPACHVHYDLTARAILKEATGIPVLHYSQLLGLAQGWSPQELGLFENRVPVDDLLEILQV
jgi:heterodisulfide reductase subunit B2